MIPVGMISGLKNLLYYLLTYALAAEETKLKFKWLSNKFLELLLGT